MTRSEILSRIQAVAAETFGCAPAQMQETTVAADIEKWDSLRHLIFVSGIEQEFGIEFDMDSIAKLTNVADLITLVETLAG
jgi:acyl carrier protein